MAHNNDDDVAPAERPRSFDNPLFADTSSPRRPADEALFPAPPDHEPPAEQPSTDASDPEPPADDPDAAESTDEPEAAAEAEATPEPEPVTTAEPASAETRSEPEPVQDRSEVAKPAVETTVAQAPRDETDRPGTTPGASAAAPHTEDRPSRLRAAYAGLDVSGVRQVAATIIWVGAVMAALLLASAALIIVLGDVNRSNALVRFVLDSANGIDLGVFDRRGGGVFVFDGKNAAAKNAVVNWGLAAITYLLAGRVLSRIVKP